MCSQGGLLSLPLNFTKSGTHQPAGKKTKSNSEGYGFWYNLELSIFTPSLVFITQARSSFILARSALHLPLVDACAAKLRWRAMGSSCTIVWTELIGARPKRSPCTSSEIGSCGKPYSYEVKGDTKFVNSFIRLGAAEQGVDAIGRLTTKAPVWSVIWPVWPIT